MGSLPFGKTESIFDPKLLQIRLTSEISIIKSDIKKNQPFNTALYTSKLEYLQKNDQDHFINFLYSKFDSLKELSFDDELVDANPLKIRKIDINKKIFPKKNKHATEFPKNKNLNKNLNIEKKHKYKNKINMQFRDKNIIKSEFYKENDLKEKSNSDRVNSFISHEGNFKNTKKSKFYPHKKHAKSTKNKDYKNNSFLSTIKSKKYTYTNLSNIKNEQINNMYSLNSIRIILKKIVN